MLLHCVETALCDQLVPSDPSDGSAAATCQTTAALSNHSEAVQRTKRLCAVDHNCALQITMQCVRLDVKAVRWGEVFPVHSNLVQCSSEHSLSACIRFQPSAMQWREPSTAECLSLV